ncbi:MAG: hypothetical protein ACI9SJ_001513 [Flavobacteriaceae bacterium]
MNTKTFTYLQANPQQISSEQQEELNQILEKYPFFQSARALQLKGFKNSNNFLYNDALKITAAYTTDRNILFDYITSDHFNQNEISEIIQQHDASVSEIEVVSENITEEISIEIDNQIKKELKKAEAILNPDLFERKVESIKEIVEENKEDKKPISETTIEINQPLVFKKEDAHSFSEWLKLTSATPIKREATVEKNTSNDEKVQKLDLIEKFIQDKPKLFSTPLSTELKEKKVENKNLAAPYTQANDSLMTETLAKVYLQQKNYKKAIQAYKILILKNPEKSGFFADQIRAIKKLTNTDNS